VNKGYVISRQHATFNTNTHHWSSPPSWINGLLWLVLALPLLIVTNLLSLALYGGDYQVQMGAGQDKLLLENFHNTEQDTQGISYRWSRGESWMVFEGFAAASRGYLLLESGGLPSAIPAPRAVQLQADGVEWMTLDVAREPRRYTLLLPPHALRDGNLEIALHTEEARVPPDTRRLGVRVDSLALGWFPAVQPFPNWRMLFVQWGLVGCAVLLAYRLHASRWRLAVVALVSILALAWMSGSNLLIASIWQHRLLITALAVLVVVWASWSLLCRLFPAQTAHAEVRWLWVIALLAIGIRMVPVLYPPFDSHDWYIHRKRIIDFLSGGFIIYDKPAEFSKKLTIVPPAPYLLYAPAMFFTKNPVVAMQWVYTFIDSFTTLLVGVLVRTLGGSIRASRLAALMVAFFPLNLTALWWGFGPQVIGQFLMVLLALFVAQEQLRSRFVWLVAGVVVSLLLLSHMGSGILGGAFLAGYVLLVWVFQRERRLHWQGWGMVLLVCGVLVLALLYSRVLELQLQGLSSNSRLGWDEDDLFRVPWTLASLYPSFKPLGVALPLLGLFWLARAVRGLHRWLVGAWLGSAGFFFLVDLAFGLQVRYAYFLVPLVAAGCAMLLDRFIQRRQIVGWVVTVCLLGLVVVAGWLLWYAGVFLAVKPSLRGLTH
jgi:hypothetical protein